MKKTMALILTVLLMTSVLCTGAYAEGGTLSFAVSSASGSSGDEVTITVSITSNPTIAALEFGISYDPNVLEKIS